MSAKIPMTQDDYERVLSLLDIVKARHSESLKAMGDAHRRNEGDGWHCETFQQATQAEQALTKRMQELERYLNRAEIVVPAEQNLEVAHGSAVTLVYPDQTKETYVLVGFACGRFDDTIHEVSTRAPFAQSLLGKRYGDKIEVGNKTATVLDVLSPSETRELIARHTVE